MIKFPCLYGIDTPSKEELVAATHNEADICKMLGADSVQFLPLEVQKGLSPNPDSFCFACMDGKYWHQPNEHS
jgi:amidophosphoribosyltransferase